MTKDKRCEITKDFYPFYVNKNKFTLKRMEKYEGKGFSFYIDTKMNPEIKKSKVIQPEEFFFNEMFKWCFNPDFSINRVKCKKYHDPTVYGKGMIKYQKLFECDYLEENDFRSIEDYEKYKCKDILEYNITNYVKSKKKYACKKYDLMMLYLIETKFLKRTKIL
jgi:hypothetical protein